MRRCVGAGLCYMATYVAAQRLPRRHQQHDSSSSSSRDAADEGRSIVGRVLYDGSKRGLEKVDKAYVQRVIDENLRGTPYYRHEQQRERERRARVRELLAQTAQYRSLTRSQLLELKQRVDAHEAELEATRDLTRRFVHVDMDMFYAAVEEKKNPRLSDVPFAVGSDACLCTSNYIARRYGVRSAMPGFIGKKLCPELRIVPTDFAAYRREAAVVRAIGKRYDPHFISVGLDELTMDVTAYLARHPRMTAAEVCRRFRYEVYAKTSLTCSGGIAPTAALAKIASNVNKPNGQHEVELRTRADVIAHVQHMPIRDIPGIGFAQERMLHALGIRHCRDFLKRKHLLCFLFPAKTFAFYLSIGLGLVRTHVDRALSQHTLCPRKSVHKEKTFGRAATSPEALLRIVHDIAADAHAVLLQERASAQVVTCYVKDREFARRSKQMTLVQPTSDFKVLYAAIKELLQPSLHLYAQLRLVGVNYSRLTFDLSLPPPLHAPAASPLVVRSHTTPFAAKARTRRTRRARKHNKTPRDASDGGGGDDVKCDTRQHEGDAHAPVCDAAVLPTTTAEVATTADASDTAVYVVQYGNTIAYLF